MHRNAVTRASTKHRPPSEFISNYARTKQIQNQYFNQERLSNNGGTMPGDTSTFEDAGGSSIEQNQFQEEKNEIQNEETVPATPDFLPSLVLKSK